MEMSKYNDLIKATFLVPQPQQQYRSWESGLQMVNHKKLTDFFNQSGSSGLIPTVDSYVLPNLTLINDNFAFCHTFFSIILLMQVKVCNNEANN